MTNTHTEVVACLTGVSLALAVAFIGIKANVDHMRAAALKSERVAQLDGRYAHHDATASAKRMTTARQF